MKIILLLFCLAGVGCRPKVKTGMPSKNKVDTTAAISNILTPLLLDTVVKKTNDEYPTFPFIVRVFMKLFGKTHVVKMIYVKEASPFKNGSDSMVDILPYGKDKYFVDDFFEELRMHIVEGLGGSDAIVEKHCRIDVNYKKWKEDSVPESFISVIDIDNDGIPEIILGEDPASGAGNPEFIIYKWSKRNKKFKKDPDFFDGSFYGWDNKYKYLITGGVWDKMEHKIKNTVTNGKLVPVKYASGDGTTTLKWQNNPPLWFLEIQRRKRQNKEK